MTSSSIPVVTSAEKANYPFIVQCKNTENWSSHSAAVSLAAALEDAAELQARYPRLPVRVEHCTGGFKVVTQLPLWKKMAPKEQPLRDALWSGDQPPPAVGSEVRIRLNNIGAAKVVGYAVVDGYLGLMTVASEHTRPDWHKKQNPDNAPALAFGCEISV